MVPVGAQRGVDVGEQGQQGAGQGLGEVLRPHFEEREMPTKFVVDAFIDKQMKLCAYVSLNA